jgi:hypothetical protein
VGGLGYNIFKTKTITTGGGMDTNEQIEAAEKEMEVAGWNWGPFMFTVLWAFVHKFWWLGLLSIIPGIGFIIGVVLGVKGNAWAWKKDPYKNQEVFEYYQRSWSKVGFLLFMIGAIFTVLGYWLQITQGSNFNPS